MFFVGGGRPNHVREITMIRDDEGLVMADKKYITANPHLFRYLGHSRINSLIVHTYSFIPHE